MSPDNGTPKDDAVTPQDSQTQPSDDLAVVEGGVPAVGDEDPSLSGEEEPVEEPAEGEGRMTLMEHLLELRKRLVRCVLGVIAGFLICYPFAEQLFDILMKPMVTALTKVAPETTSLPADFFPKFQAAVAQGLAGTDFPYMDQLGLFFDSLQQSMVKVVLHQGQFIYTYPPEAFFAHVKVGMVAGFFLMSPYLFYQLWGFVAPGLYSHEPALGCSHCVDFRLVLRVRRPVRLFHRLPLWVRVLCQLHLRHDFVYSETFGVFWAFP